MQKGLSSCIVISAQTKHKEKRVYYVRVYHRWANIKRDRNGIIFDDSRNLRGTASTGVGVHRS